MRRESKPVTLPQDSLYETLEVSPNASPAVIRAAYRCLVQLCHPDKNPGDASAAERLSSINQAYAVLSDAQARTRYDQQARDRRGKGRTAPVAQPKPDAEPKLRPFVFRNLG